MARQRLEKIQVDVVYLLGNQLLLDAAGTVRLSNRAAALRPAGFYLALRPTAASDGDYSGSRYVGPLVSAIAAEKLKVSALALGAHAATIERPGLIVSTLDESDPTATAAPIPVGRVEVWPPKASKLRDHQNLGAGEWGNRGFGPIACGHLAHQSSPGDEERCR